MPDLGEHAIEILLAYAVSLGLIGFLLGVSFWQYRRAKAALDRVEQGLDG